MPRKLRNPFRRKPVPQSNSVDNSVPGEQPNQTIEGSNQSQLVPYNEENAPLSIAFSASDPAQEPRPSVQSSSLGLNVLYEPPRTIDPIADIVFVHGLTGGSYTTWRHERTGLYWPQELLGKDLGDARIFSFGYDADVVNFWNPASSNRVGNHAENLLGSLSRIRGRTESEHRKIIFVAHSLGGLVIENALSISRGSAEKHIKSIEQHTIAIAFLGTPHHGSDLAAWGTFGTKLSRIAARPNSAIIEVLQPGSEMLAVIQQGFHSILRIRKDEGAEIAVTCFFEELPLRAVGEVVPKHSAIIPGYSSYGIHANHEDMTKFANASDKGYDDVFGEVFRWVKALRTPVGQLGQHLQEYLKSLDHEDLNVRQENVKDALTKTCEWIWDSRGKLFSSWFLSSGGLLWISGKPGSGKSTIMKYLSFSHERFHELARQTQGRPRGAQLVIATYFLDFQGSALARSVEGMMRSLLHQILKQLPQLQKAVLPHFEEIRQTRNEFAWRRSDLERAFQMAMQRESNFRFLVLVDALDEYQGEEVRLAEFLTALSETYPHKLHICVSSRTSAELKDQLRRYPNICMEEETAQDIQHYVVIQFQNMLSGNESFKRLADSVIRAAEGVFIWVKLVCDELLRAWRRGEDPARLDQRLEGMPKELDAFYQRILDALDAEDREEARLMLSIVTSAIRPLRPIELRFALHHAVGLYNDFNNSSLAITRVLAVCGGLLELKLGINHSTVDCDEKELLHVYLTHRTVGTFLATRQGSFLDLDRNRCTVTGDYHLLRACINMLISLTESDLPSAWREAIRLSSSLGTTAVEFVPLSESPEFVFPKIPFLDYSMNQWVCHARQAEADTEEAQTILRHLSAFRFCLWRLLMMWSGYSFYHKELADGISTPITLLEYVLSINLELCAKDLLSLNPSDHPDVAVTDVNTNGGIFLFAVAYGGSFKLAQTLFDKGATISRSLPYAWRALVRAIHLEHPVLAQLFLQHGADPNERVFYNKDCIASPLQVAVDSAQPEMLKILADWGVDLNATVGLYFGSGTALQAAVEYGDLELLKALLDAGADVNFVVPDCIHGTVLAAALFRWHCQPHGSSPAMIELLLQRGADPNFKSAWTKQPLIWDEIKRDDIMTVSKLLEHGADANAVGPQRHGPLYWVLAVHSTSSLSNAGAIGQILLQHGAILSPQDLVKLASAGVLPQIFTSPFNHKQAFEEFLKLAKGDTLEPVLQRLFVSYVRGRRARLDD